jgi:hypothetical protein
VLFKSIVGDRPNEPEPLETMLANRCAGSRSAGAYTLVPEMVPPGPRSSLATNPTAAPTLSDHPLAVSSTSGSWPKWSRTTKLWWNRRSPADSAPCYQEALKPGNPPATLAEQQ